MIERTDFFRAFVVALVLCSSALAVSLIAAPAEAQSAVQISGQDDQAASTGGNDSARAARNQASAKASRLEVYAHTFRYRDASQAANMVRHRLSPRGTVEVQPSANTLVVRDIGSILERIKPTLVEFDQPPAKLRLELRVVKAEPKSVVSPPASGGTELPAQILDKLESLFRYDTYRVVAEAAVSSLEGESVDYSLGPDYSVSFKLGSLMAQRRLHMEDFRIVERLSSDKGRGLDPKQLFHADLNLWIDRPFTLVLTRDDTRQEALLVAITGHIETPAVSGADSPR